MPTTQKVSTETILETLAAHPRLTAADLVEVLGIGRSTAAKHLATDHAAPDDPVGPTDRLAHGELGALVHDYLAERPGEAFGQ